MSEEAGSAQSGVDWLDVHLEACRADYEAMLGSTGLQPGWRAVRPGKEGAAPAIGP